MKKNIFFGIFISILILLSILSIITYNFLPNVEPIFFEYKSYSAEPSFVKEMKPLPVATGSAVTTDELIDFYLKLNFVVKCVETVMIISLSGYVIYKIFSAFF